MIKILTDACANLSEKYITDNNLGIINLYLAMDNKEVDYQSPNFNIKEFYNKMRQGSAVNTSLTNTQTFIDCFEKYLQDSDQLIFISMSSGISGSTGCAKLAADILNEKYSDRKIAVIDSLAASLGEGLLVMRGVEMLKNGCCFEEIVETLEAVKTKIHQLFIVSDLKYLKKGGRISTAKAVVGTVLNIIPILMGDEEGKIVLYKKTRGIKKSLQIIADEYEKLSTNKSADIAIAHADDEENANYLLNCLKEKGFCGKCFTEVYEPVTGSHVGPGAIAMFFINSKS